MCFFNLLYETNIISFINFFIFSYPLFNILYTITIIRIQLSRKTYKTLNYFYFSTTLLSYSFSITPFITKKFKIIVIGVTSTFETIAEKLFIKSTLTFAAIPPFITLKNLDIKKIITH